MREHGQIIERWHRGSTLILITLVRVQGSSYRQPGARLMVCKAAEQQAGGLLDIILCQRHADDSK
jgi:xanthine dehydrogenase accessory factor